MARSWKQSGTQRPLQRLETRMDQSVADFQASLAATRTGRARCHARSGEGRLLRHVDADQSTGAAFTPEPQLIVTRRGPDDLERHGEGIRPPTSLQSLSDGKIIAFLSGMTEERAPRVAST